MKKGLIKKVVASALLGIMTMGLVGCGSADNTSSKETKDLLETIQEKGKVVVGMSADYAPYEFHYIDENGKDVIGGFDVDIANEIADAIGVELVIQEMDFDALSLILKNPVYSFSYKDTETPSIGILAQDVQNVNIKGFDLVDNKEASGYDFDYMHVHEGKLVYIL